MPVTYEFDGSILVLRLVGRYSPAEVRTALGAALEEPGRPALTGFVADLRYSESLASRTLGDATAIVGFLAYHAPSYGNRIALVPPCDGDDTLVRMSEVDLQTAGIMSTAVRDIDDARRWLRR